MVSAVPGTPAHVIDKVNRLIVNFFWIDRGKKPKIKSDTLIGSKDQGKRHIFTQRFEQKTPNIDLFFDFVKGKLIVHKCIFQSKGLINKFHSLWKPLLCLL